MQEPAKNVQTVRRTTLLHSQAETIAKTLRSPALPLRAKAQFLWRGLARHRTTEDSYSLDLRSGRIFLSVRDDKIDRCVVREIFVQRLYDTDFRGAFVVDVGAHKGYFGAYALTSGAMEIVSFEPERENFGLLERTAESFRRRGLLWDTRRAAVASVTGEAGLRVGTESWAHSLTTLTADRADAGTVETVRCEAMQDVLERVRRRSSRGPLIVKINAEGAECDIVLGTPVDLWRLVDEAFIEVHDFAPCSSRDIVEHLGEAGLTLGGTKSFILHLRRETGTSGEQRP